MPPRISQFVHTKVPDEPLVQDATYRFDPADRRFIDEQIRGIQQLLAQGAFGSTALRGAETSDRLVQAVAATPGWYVACGFRFNAAQSNGVRVFQATVIASTSALQVRCRLVRADTSQEVSGSLLTFAAPVNALEQTLVTSNLSSVLVDGQHYQIQVECTGGASPGDFAILRSAGVYAN